jgi:hypothetical protein
MIASELELELELLSATIVNAVDDDDTLDGRDELTAVAVVHVDVDVGTKDDADARGERIKLRRRQWTTWRVNRIT